MLNLVKNELKKALPVGIEPEVFPSEKPEFGHYSTNVAFKIAPGLKKSPFEIAKDLARKLGSPSTSSGSIFEKVEAVQPGFVNLWLKPEVLYKELKEILSKRQASSVKRQGLKINVEFVSANPTGPLTMANGRGGFYGDVLANVLEKTGHKVTREYYVNDTGNQIKLLGESILAATGNSPAGRPDKEEYYKGAYIKNLAKNKVILRLAQDKSNAEHISKKAAALLLKEIKASLKKAGIKHDEFFSEDKNLHKKGELKKVLALLEKKKLVEEKEGAKWLGDNVLIKSDGNPTYFLADLAYHYDKFLKRKFDIAIDIWGADHHGYIARMKKGVEAIGVDPKRLQIIIMQLVRLVSGGKEVKMSKRSGEFVTMDELLDEVGVDAARFFFLMHSPDTHMDFDLDLAKERSQKNPVYYTQYAYVRCLSILRRVSGVRRQASGNLNLLESDPEVKLMLELVKFPDILAETAQDYQVHRLTKYATDLARAFHNFYEKEKVIGPVRNSPPMGSSDRASAGAVSNGMGADLQNARLALVTAVKVIFENLFDILGISKPKKM